MTTDIIRYDLMVQDALRGVVRKVLTDSAREGLPGEHHYYITFLTDAPGVRLSNRMREKYPGEMTIILQHQFWDLTVSEQNFEVGLSFNNIPERLLIPFEAITGFFDPSVQFGLKFEVQESVQEAGANDTAPPEPSAKASAGKPARIGAKVTDGVKVGSDKNAGDKAPGQKASGDKAGRAVANEVSSKPTGLKSSKSADGADPEAADAASTKVVSIEAFRKKPSI